MVIVQRSKMKTWKVDDVGLADGLVLSVDKIDVLLASVMQMVNSTIVDELRTLDDYHFLQWLWIATADDALECQGSRKKTKFR